MAHTADDDVHCIVCGRLLWTSASPFRDHKCSAKAIAAYERRLREEQKKADRAARRTRDDHMTGFDPTES